MKQSPKEPFFQVVDPFRCCRSCYFRCCMRISRCIWNVKEKFAYRSPMSFPYLLSLIAPFKLDALSIFSLMYV